MVMTTRRSHFGAMAACPDKRVLHVIEGQRRSTRMNNRSAFPIASWIALATAIGLLWPAALPARIKLITLPLRERVEIQLDHPDVTLVEEERIVPLVKTTGADEPNQVDFSWANTAIDPQTIVFRVIGPAAGDGMQVRVLSVSYPPNEQALVWQVAASQSGAARVRISYVLGNLSKSFNYRAVAAHDEKTLALAQYMRLQNFANEEFMGNFDADKGANLWAGWGRRFTRPVGLNETKEMLVEKFTRVPIRKTYTCNPAEYDYLDRPQNKLRVPMHYVLKNSKESNLGTGPLPYGKVRIFIEPRDPKDAALSSTFLGEDWGAFTPLDDEMKLYLGVAQDIVVKRTIDKSERQRVAGNLFNHEVVVKYEIENFKDRPVVLDIQENLRHVRSEIPNIGNQGRDVEWELLPATDLEGGADKEKTTFEEVLFHIPLPARDMSGKAEKLVRRLHVRFRNEW
jgi:hypothetical protein